MQAPGSIWICAAVFVFVQIYIYIYPYIRVHIYLYIYLYIFVYMDSIFGAVIYGGFFACLSRSWPPCWHRPHVGCRGGGWGRGSCSPLHPPR